MRKLAILLTTFLSLKALASAPILFEGTDISPAVDFFAKQIRTVKTPFTTYNWSNSEALGDGEASYKYVLAAADGYWKSFGAKENQGNLYGYGLYTSIDPVTTHSYGDAHFLLREIKFPVGLHILNIAVDLASDNNIQRIMNTFLCSSTSTDGLFTAGGANLEPSCQRLMAKIFRDILKIDAFSYNYASTSFSACSGNIQARAFVIVRSSWLGPDLVHLYTKSTRANIEQRSIIQSLFFQEDLSFNKYELTRKYVEAHPDKFWSDELKEICEGSQCSIYAKLCDDDGCKDVKIMTYSRGPFMTEDAAHITSPGKLLWPDLEGRPQVNEDTVRDWLQSNIHGCSGKSPYQEKETGQ